MLCFAERCAYWAGHFSCSVRLVICTSLVSYGYGFTLGSCEDCNKLVSLNLPLMFTLCLGYQLNTFIDDPIRVNSVYIHTIFSAQTDRKRKKFNLLLLFFSGEFIVFSLSTLTNGMP